MSETRLQKYLSECGVASRRASEALILEGKVKVNDQIVTKLGTKVNPLHDKVAVRNKIVTPPDKGIVLMHKPSGVVCTMFDPQERPTIADYLNKHLRSYYPVGRLDFDTSGLLVLTNDGELAQHLLHPRYAAERVYHARVAGRVEERTLNKLARGILLDDGMARANVKILKTASDSTWLEVKVAEGRNRLVRRLFAKLFHPVMKLRRVSHGPFELGSLEVGKLKQLTPRDYKRIRSRIFGPTRNVAQKESKS